MAYPQGAHPKFLTSLRLITNFAGAETGSTRVIKASCGVRLSAVTGYSFINANDNFVVANDNFAGAAGDAIAA